MGWVLATSSQMQKYSGVRVICMVVDSISSSLSSHPPSISSLFHILSRVHHLSPFNPPASERKFKIHWQKWCNVHTRTNFQYSIFKKGVLHVAGGVATLLTHFHFFTCECVYSHACKHHPFLSHAPSLSHSHPDQFAH